MEWLLLDEKYDALDIVDEFESLQWVDRYNECGDFELVIPAHLPIVSKFEIGRYLYSRHTDRYMIVEEISIVTNEDNHDTATIVGRSLESILDRRVVWNYTIVNGGFQDCIKQLLENNVINPSNSVRKIPGFSFKASEDKKVTDEKITIETAYHGETVYEVIREQCQLHDLGFRVLPSGEGGFEFSLYCGTDRSYAQDELPWIVFSHKYENILKSNYCKNIAEYKNVACVLGEGEESARDVFEIKVNDTDNFSGLERREMSVNSSARVDESNYPNEDDYDADDSGDLDEEEYARYAQAYNAAVAAAQAQYRSEITTDGKTALDETKMTEVFDGEVDPYGQFTYGKDFFLGDVVQVVNEYGREATCRVTELALTQDSSGETILPSFVTVIEDSEESK